MSIPVHTITSVPRLSDTMCRTISFLLCLLSPGWCKSALRSFPIGINEWGRDGFANCDRVNFSNTLNLSDKKVPLLSETFYYQIWASTFDTKFGRPQRRKPYFQPKTPKQMPNTSVSWTLCFHSDVVSHRCKGFKSFSHILAHLQPRTHHFSLAGEKKNPTLENLLDRDAVPLSRPNSVFNLGSDWGIARLRNFEAPMPRLEVQDNPNWCVLKPPGNGQNQKVYSNSCANTVHEHKPLDNKSVDSNT